MRPVYRPISGSLAGLLLFVAVTHRIALGAEREPTTQELIEIAQNTVLDSETRTDALKKLGAIKASTELRDKDLVNTMLKIVARNNDDLFVRNQAILNLGHWQYHVYNPGAEAKNQYIEPLTKLLLDNEEHYLTRKAVAKVFEDTLQKGGLKDSIAYKAILELAEDSDYKDPRKAAPIDLRVQMINVIGAYGELTRGFSTLATILKRREPDTLLKEAVLAGFEKLLSKIDPQEFDRQPLDVPTVNIMIETMKNKEVENEIRARVMMAMAYMKKGGVAGMDRAMEAILAIFMDKTNEDRTLIVACIRALGIAADPKYVAPLSAAYKEFFDLKNPAREDHVAIRQAIVKTLSNILSAQRIEIRPGRGPDAKAIEEIGKVYIEILASMLDTNDANNEVPQVVASTVFSARYFYPKHQAFDGPKKEIVANLIRLLENKASETYRESLIETLEAITGRGFGKNVDRWHRWFDQTYPGFAIKKPDAPK